MDVSLLALEHLRQQAEAVREAATATDERVANAREAIREVTAGYREFVSRVHDPGLLLLIHVAFGLPLQRAAVAIGEPSP